MVGEDPVGLLGEGVAHVIGPQARFHVADRNLLIESGQSRRKGRHRVSMHEHQVRFFLFQDGRDLFEHFRHDVLERLVLLHDIHVVVRAELEKHHHLVEHRAMLRGEDHDSLKIIRALAGARGRPEPF